ncbi:MAG: ABC transporter ATP-binding protein [Treponemataceae bacterium]
MSDIRFHSVRKTYGSKTVLQDLNLHIRSGECFVLIGPSGCGKTVALRLIAGFETPDEGEITIGERVVANAKHALPPEERRIGVVFQDYAVWPHMDVSENVAYPLKMRKTEKAESQRRTADAVAQVDLAGYERRLPSQLSGGQQQRVALARALVAEPEVMLLDEPLTNLDANLREEMRFEIKDLQRKTGSTILYVTHDHEVALAIADRIAVMDPKGNLRQIGTPEAVYEHPADPFVCRFLGVSSFVEMEKKGGRFVIRGTDFSVGNPPAALADESEALAAFRPMDMTISRPSGAIPEGSAEGVVERTSLLGPIIDFRILIGEQKVRCQIQTEEAVARNVIIEEGSRCALSFHDAKWFSAVADGEEEA